MSLYSASQLLLVFALIVLIGSIIYVLLQLKRTLDSFKQLLDSVNRDLPPLMAKFERSLDGVNAELGHVEQIVASFQEVSSTVHRTTGLVQRVVANPFIKASSLVSGAGAALSRLVKRSDNGAKR